MATKKATKTAKAGNGRATSMSDEDIVAFIAKHLGKDPEAGQGAVLKALRAAGKSASGGRLRKLFEQGRKASKGARGAAGPRPKSAAGMKRAGIVPFTKEQQVGKKKAKRGGNGSAPATATEPEAVTA